MRKGIAYHVAIISERPTGGMWNDRHEALLLEFNIHSLHHRFSLVDLSRYLLRLSLTCGGERNESVWYSVKVTTTKA